MVSDPAVGVGVVGGTRLAEEASAEASATAPATAIQRVRLTLAIERWPGGGATLYGAAQGLFLALLRGGAAQTAQALHDTQERKRFALSPLRVEAGQNGRVARADLTMTVWDATLADALAAGSSAALDAALDVAGHSAHVLDAQEVTRISYQQLLDRPSLTAEHGVVRRVQMPPIGTTTKPHGAGQPPIWVRFATPTVFSWGRGRDGRHRYALLPSPELVVGSWLRTWNAGGGPVLSLREEAEWLRDCIRIQAVRSLQTVTIHTGKTPLSGFVGEIALDWCGTQPGGFRALRALAGFAAFCGTGAKTAYGLGQTVTWQ